MGKSVNEKVELLAEYAHSAWSGWMKYLFSKSSSSPSISVNTGFPDYVTIPSGLVQRWHTQMNTPYQELSDEEQESDRVEARKILALLKEHEKTFCPRCGFEYSFKREKELRLCATCFRELGCPFPG